MWKQPPDKATNMTKKRKMMMIVVVVIAYISSMSNVAGQEYRARNGGPISAVSITDNDEIFVATPNELARLRSADLSTSETKPFGPVKDSPLCSPDGASCIGRPQLVDTDVQSTILVPLKSKDQSILECAAVRQGSCRLRNAKTLAEIDGGSTPPLVSVREGDDRSTLVVPLENGRLAVAALPSIGDESPYREGHPFVAVREPPFYQVVNQGDLDGEAAVFLRADARLSFSKRAKLIEAWTHRHHVYFLAVFPTSSGGAAPAGSSASSGLTTKLVRICANDTRFASYSELELQCRDEDNSSGGQVASAAAVFGDTLAVTFVDAAAETETNNGGGGGGGGGSSTRLCVYNLLKVSQTIWYNADRCRAGAGRQGMPHVGRDAACTGRASAASAAAASSSSRLDESQCEVGAGEPIEQLELAAARIPGKRASAIAIIPLEEKDSTATTDFVLVLGTTRGRLIWLRPVSTANSTTTANGKWEAYAEKRSLDLDDGEDLGNEDSNGEQTKIRSLAYLRPDRLLVRTGDTIKLAPSADCARFSTCQECTAGKSTESKPDPQCAWCPARQKCTTAAQCSAKSRDVLLPRARVPEACPREIMETASSEPELVKMDSQVEMPLDRLSAPKHFRYECWLLARPNDTTAMRTRFLANWKGGRVKCALGVLAKNGAANNETTATDVLRWDEETGTAEGVLALKTSLASGDANFLTQKAIKIMDCTKRVGCAACTTDRNADCVWCASAGCVDKESQCQAMITAQHQCTRVIGDGGSRGSRPTVILRPKTADGLVQLALENGEQLTKRRRVECAVLNEENGDVVATEQAQVASDGSSVACKIDRRVGLRSNNTATMRGLLSRMGGVETSPLRKMLELASDVWSIRLRDGDSIVDTVKVISYDCSLLAADCSSCRALDAKLACSWCGGKCASDCQGDSSATCAPPTLSSVLPRRGPSAGGTVVQFAGKELRSIADWRGGILIGDSECLPPGDDENAPITVNLTDGTLRCKTTATRSVGVAKVRIAVAGEEPKETGLEFEFVVPSVTTPPWPALSSASGGALIAIRGRNLDAGEKSTVRFGDVECTVVNRTSERINCVTGATKGQRALKTTRLSVRIDDALLESADSFEFVAPPELVDAKPLAAFRAGGRKIQITGRRLDTIREARLVYLSEDGNLLGGPGKLCNVRNETVMQCEAPPTLGNFPNFGSESFVTVRLGVLLDRQQQAKIIERAKFTLVADPEFAPFPGGLKRQNIGELLILNGRRLAAAAHLDEYKITIGETVCEPTLLDGRQLACLPSPGISANARSSIVRVQIGRFGADLGLLDIGSGGSLSTGEPTPRLYLLAAATLLAAVTLLTVLLIVMRRRKRSGRRSPTTRRFRGEFDDDDDDGESGRGIRKIPLPPNSSSPSASPVSVSSTLPPQRGKRQLLLDASREERQELPSLMEMQLSVAMERSANMIRSRRQIATKLMELDGKSTSSTACLYGPEKFSTAVAQFDALLAEPTFVHALIDACASEQCVDVPGLIFAALATRNLHYLTDIVLVSMARHVARKIQLGQTDQLFRDAALSPSERLASKWLLLVGARFLTTERTRGNDDSPAAQLHKLLRAVSALSTKGPVDGRTGKSRFALHPAWILDAKEQQQTANVLDVRALGPDGPVSVKLLTCDTLAQAKQKVLDLVYANVPFSQRPLAVACYLEYQCPLGGAVLLAPDGKPDNEETIVGTMGRRQQQKVGKNTDKSCQRTIGDFGLEQGALLALRVGSLVPMPRRPPSGNLPIPPGPCPSSSSSSGSGSSSSQHYSNRTLRRATALRDLALGYSTLTTSAATMMMMMGSGQKAGGENRSSSASSSTTTTQLSSGYDDMGTASGTAKMKKKKRKGNNQDEHEDETERWSKAMTCKTAIQPWLDAFLDTALLLDLSPDEEAPTFARFLLSVLEAEARAHGLPPLTGARWFSRLISNGVWRQLLLRPDLVLDTEPPRGAVAAGLAMISDGLCAWESSNRRRMLDREIGVRRAAEMANLERVLARRDGAEADQIAEEIGALGANDVETSSAVAPVSALLAWTRSHATGVVSELTREGNGNPEVQQQILRPLEQLLAAPLENRAAEQAYATIADFT